MPANFFTQGEIQLFVRPRNLHWEYLGTAVTTPQVRSDISYSYAYPGPYYRLFGHEAHTVSVVLNRLHHRTWNRIRDVSQMPGGGDNLVRRLKEGRMMENDYDFELFLKYSLPFQLNAPQPPDGASKGRRYYSAVVKGYEEEAPGRSQEVAVLFECGPLAIGHEYLLFTEKATDYPEVTAE